MKKDNLITRFRKFFFSLPKEEQADLWQIMTALRSEDDGRHYLKSFTTCRIRGELLGKSGYEKVMYGCFVALNLLEAKDFERYQRYSVKTTMAEMKKANTHWGGHFHRAIMALNKYRPEKAMRDLQKFLNY